MQSLSPSSLALRFLAGANVVLGFTSIFIIGELIMVALGRASYQGQPYIDTASVVFGIISIVIGLRCVIQSRGKQETIVLGLLFCVWIVWLIIGATR